MRVYSIMDRKMREYGQLSTFPNDETAMRAVQDGVRGSNSTVEKHPTDFDLMCVGQFDVDLGVLQQMSGEPRFVENVAVLLGIDILKPEGSHAAR